MSDEWDTRQPVNQAAAIVGCSDQTVRNMIKNGLSAHADPRAGQMVVPRELHRYIIAHCSRRRPERLQQPPATVDAVDGHSHRYAGFDDVLDMVYGFREKIEAHAGSIPAASLQDLRTYTEELFKETLDHRRQSGFLEPWVMADGKPPTVPAIAKLCR